MVPSSPGSPQLVVEWARCPAWDDLGWDVYQPLDNLHLVGHDSRFPFDQCFCWGAWVPYTNSEYLHTLHADIRHGGRLHTRKHIAKKRLHKLLAMLLMPKNKHASAYAKSLHSLRGTANKHDQPMKHIMQFPFIEF